MLSVLIPVYNYDVQEFVSELSTQADRCEYPVEIICLDDGSEGHFREMNATVDQYAHVVYKVSDQNLGRSKVRNELASMAQYDHFLFLDCDGRCVSQDYLQRYLDRLDGYDVIYGGRVYSEEAPDDHALYFHWYYGSAREAVLTEQRIEKPFKSFMTNNFLIRRSVYEAVKMDEGVIGYGHEDTLFALELKREGFHIQHLENPIEHTGIETAEVFMEKSANGVKNLAQLMLQNKMDDSIRLVRFYHRFQRFGLTGLISTLTRRFEHRIFRSLKGPAPNLLWFDLWKLGKLHEALK